MKILISGSYHFGRVDFIDRVISESGFIVTTVLNGGAPGIETAALDWARLTKTPFVNLGINRIKAKMPDIRKDKYLASEVNGAIFIIRPFTNVCDRGGEIGFLLTETSCRGKPYFLYVVRTPLEDRRYFYPSARDLVKETVVLEEKPKEIIKEKEPDLFG
jgi:hypothetical protein